MAIDATAAAARWTRIVSALHTAQLRRSWLREALRAMVVRDAAEVLDVLCADAERGDARAAVAMHAVVELFSDPALDPARRALRDEARDAGLVTVGRVLHFPIVARRDARDAPRRDSQLPPRDDAPNDEPAARDVPDYGKGRTLTLGERKALARRPPKELLPKVLADPHPDVIRNLLASPRLTEEHVVTIATRRPGRPEVLAEIARHPRWCHRPRLRMSLVLNPATPVELAITMVALLHRSELSLVVESTAIPPAVRSAARERLVRLPPLRPTSDGRVQ